MAHSKCYYCCNCCFGIKDHGKMKLSGFCFCFCSFSHVEAEVQITLYVSSNASQLPDRSMLPWGTVLATRANEALKRESGGLRQQYHPLGGWHKNPLSGFVHETPLLTLNCLPLGRQQCTRNQSQHMQCTMLGTQKHRWPWMWTWLIYNWKFWTRNKVKDQN